MELKLLASVHSSGSIARTPRRAAASKERGSGLSLVRETVKLRKSRAWAEFGAEGSCFVFSLLRRDSVETFKRSQFAAATRASLVEQHHGRYGRSPCSLMPTRRSPTKSAP